MPRSTTRSPLGPHENKPASGVSNKQWTAALGPDAVGSMAHTRPRAANATLAASAGTGVRSQRSGRAPKTVRARVATEPPVVPVPAAPPGVDDAHAPVATVTMTNVSLAARPPPRRAIVRPPRWDSD